jgi:putative transposase
VGLVARSFALHLDAAKRQRRFWEHQLRNTDDFARHVDYIHFNPVKHGSAQTAIEWPHSTFHRFVRDGIYAPNWSGGNIKTLSYD